MEAPKAQIKCSVSDCRYNNQQICRASSIVVNPVGDNIVNTPDGTKCSTFTKNSSF